LTNATGYTTANLVGTISNAQLANSTISGVSLGSNLANLTAGTNINFSVGTTYNGSSAITISATGAAQVYPGAGIANSTGTAWGTSYTTTGTGTVVALATSPTFVTPILGTPTSGTLTNTTGFPAANLAGTALPSAIVTSSLTALGTVATGVWNGTAIGIAYGGTGQTTAGAAFNALSPITTTGDLILGNGTNSATRLAIGANTYVLTSNGTTASWVAPSGGGSAATPTALGTVYGSTSSSNSIASIGYQSLNVNTGTLNSAIGYQAGISNTSGSSNTYIGSYAGYYVTTGSTNTACGVSALSNQTVGATGSSNTAIGYQASYYNTSAIENVAVGFKALLKNTTGNYNTAIGSYALNANTTASSNTVVGYLAGYLNTTAGANTLIGNYSGYSLNTTGDTVNCFVGYTAGYGTTTGTANTFVGGASAGSGNTSGSQNVATGNRSLLNNTTGSYNTTVGYEALKSNTTSNLNVAVGYQALYTTTERFNTAVGGYAGYSDTNGEANSLLGYNAGYGLTSGSNNVCVGTNAGYGQNVSGVNLTTGGAGIYVGGYAYPSASGNNYEIVIGYNTVGKGGSTGIINSNYGGTYQGNNQATWSVSSDQRLKKNIVDNNVGLDKVAQIQVRNFEYRNEDEVTDLPKNQVIKKEGIQLGVIAQELQQILPDCVKQESTGVMAVEHDNIMWHMINAIKELNAKVIALETKLGV